MKNIWQSGFPKPMSPEKTSGFKKILRSPMFYFVLIFAVILSLRFLPQETSSFVSFSPSIVKLTRTRWKLPRHPSLFSFGRIIVHHPGQYPRGGPAAMNYLHCGMVNAGFNSFMFIPITSILPANCTRAINGDFKPTGHDIVIIAEVAYSQLVSHWRSTGARVVIYMLGLHVPILNQYHTDIIWAPSSTYTRDLYLATGKQVLFSPLERFIYETHEKNQRKANGASNIYSTNKSKENLIIYDNDSRFPKSLQLALSKLPLHPPVSFRELLGIPFEDIPSWYQRAKIVIDLGLPGVERINNEAAIFDAIVLVGDILNGMDPTDFPIPYRYKLDIRDENQMFNVIKDCLINYEKLLPIWRPLKELSLDLPRRYVDDEIPSFFSSRSIKFLLITSSLEEESAIIPFALHCAVHLPLARIEARVQNLGQFQRNHDMILKVLKDIVNLSRDWLLIVDQNVTNSSNFASESQFVITMDPRNFLIDEQLPNVLIHLLKDRSAIVIEHSAFGDAARVRGNVDIYQSKFFGQTNPSKVNKIDLHYSTILEEQLINIYNREETQAMSQGVRLAHLLYATQQHKLLQAILPLAVPRFTEVLKNFEKIYPRQEIYFQ